jgi:hypothetical protein
MNHPFDRKEAYSLLIECLITRGIIRDTEKELSDRISELNSRVFRLENKNHLD